MITLFNNGDPMYKEFNELGSYFAFIKHDLHVRQWQNTSVKMTNHETIFRYMPNFHDRHINNLQAIYKTNWLDRSIYDIVHKNSLEILKYRLGQSERDEDRINYFFWDTWTARIENIIDAFLGMPESLTYNHIRTDLDFVYNTQYQRLTERIGDKEFAKILGVSSKEFKEISEKIPLPVQYINGGLVPLWTLGQAECTKLTYDYLHTGRTLKPEDPTEKFTFQFTMVEDNGSEEENVYEFENSAYTYMHNDTYHLWAPETSLDDAILIAKFIFDRVKVAPEVYYSLGDKLLRAGYLEEAKEQLIKSKEIHERYIPDDFQGCISANSHEEYHYTLLDLAYIFSKEGNYNAAEEMISKAAFYGREEAIGSEELEKFKKSSEDFIRSYEETHEIPA
ncbi:MULTISPECIES: tetratricopeptide repeat protein [unclassified Paenibacillus]|uniref:tetratricopeptide repeat protein n=1 Tax=unclassified Paenibacillus TaxID=185978 RepID=UPI002787F8B1|nr:MULTISPECIES: tetratricopeptide repeat protein [unclassified Paenibacillus]MDQ0896289.1 tetratricopeptide (TPR) repeat protein [Paenibacillus sp. V4I7]MDQ0913783.1 tetratricopeptide (TPR) repeat protein [Paenibacillus sp. V4I5]